jgi:hypothetical protein
MDEERVLVYTGPELDHDSIRERIPAAIIQPPVSQGDFISDLMHFEPSHVLLITGCFHQALSVWHKEIVWALQVPGVKGIYGAASMGALRAADLSPFGMIGAGRIFHWYNEGVITEESEVASTYAHARDGSLVATTIPLVNVRGALMKALETEVLEQEEAEEIFALASSIHWTERTERMLAEYPILLEILRGHNQKAIDALELLCTFRELKQADNAIKPTEEALSWLFSAQFERDRAIWVGQQHIKLQDLDAFITLHDQEYEQHTEDADNRTLALLLADIYRIPVTNDEINQEWQRSNIRRNLRSLEEHDRWMREHHLNGKELVRILSEEVRLRKLRRALMVRSGPRRRTQRLLDYLKLSGQYVYWTNAAGRHEAQVAKKGGEEALTFGGQVDIANLLARHAQRAGLTISLSLEDYVREMGFGTVRELMVALARDRLGDAKLPE